MGIGASRVDPVEGFSIGEEKQITPFMRTGSAEILESLRKHDPDVGSDPVSVLGAVRRMKDRF